MSERDATGPSAPLPDLLCRERLVSALDDSAGWRVAAVRALAGAGKTRALAGWAAAADAFPLLELSNDENNPAGFTSALGRTVGVDVAHLLEQPRLAEPSEIVGSILGQAADRVLVLDAIENITHPWVLGAVECLLQGATTERRVVISGRTMPRLTTLAVLRVRDELVDIDDTHLRLDHREAAQLFRMTNGVSAPWPDLTVLLDHSEGWAAGFRLAARRWRPNAAHGRDWMDSSETAISSYLLGDVVGRLPRPLVDFLLETSVLEQLSPAACDAVRNADDSAWSLRELVRQNAFIVPVPGLHATWRLHGMMRSALEEELQSVSPRRHRLAHSRAAAWCHASGDDIGAMSHIVAAGDVERAWATFHDHWIERFYSADFITVLRWIGVLSSQPNRTAGRVSELAIAFIAVGRPRRAEPLIVEASLLAEADNDDPYMIEIARFLLAFSRGSFELAIEHARAAHRHAGESEPELWRRLRLSIPFSFALGFMDQPQEAMKELSKARRYEDPASPLDNILLQSAAASLALFQGNLGAAQEHADLSLEAGRFLPSSEASTLCEPTQTRAFVHLERNELDDAEAMLSNCLEVADAHLFAHVRVLGRLGLARVRHARGHRDAAFELLDECRHLPDTQLDLHLWERICEVEANLRLCESDPASALLALPERRSRRSTFVEVRARAALGQTDAALALLATIELPGARRGVQSSLVRARCTTDAGERFAHMVDALVLAERFGFVRVVLDERSWILDYLFELVATWPTQFVSRLIDGSLHDLAVNQPSASLPQLSERELEIWRYLATPLPLGEIARRLYISRNTMKTHVRSIYRKLGVSNRSDAVAVRREVASGKPPAT